MEAYSASQAAEMMRENHSIGLVTAGRCSCLGLCPPRTG